MVCSDADQRGISANNQRKNDNDNGDGGNGGSGGDNKHNNCQRTPMERDGARAREGNKKTVSIRAALPTHSLMRHSRAR